MATDSGTDAYCLIQQNIDDQGGKTMAHLHNKLMKLFTVAMLSIGVSTLHAATPSLTAGIWTITGQDVAGNVWDDSTITFESQVAQGVDFQVSGYFIWTGNEGAAFGRENFSGTLFENNHLTLNGFELVPPTQGIVTNFIYEADVTAEGTRMINGTWGGSGIPSNSWIAVQAVPEPEQWVMLLTGLTLISLKARSKAVNKQA